MFCELISTSLEHKVLWDNWEFWIALFTLILAGATIWLVIRTGSLIKSAENSSERQLRAYVGIELGAVLLNSPNEGNVTAWLRFKNFGVTPAYKVKCWHNFHRKPTNQIPFNEINDFENEHILGPNSTMNSSSTLPINQEILEQIISRDLSFFIWGEVEYVDTFKKKRFFTFKSVINGPLETVLIDGIRAQGWGLRSAADGFNAD